MAGGGCAVVRLLPIDRPFWSVRVFLRSLRSIYPDWSFQVGFAPAAHTTQQRKRATHREHECRGADAAIHPSQQICTYLKQPTGPTGGSHHHIYSTVALIWPACAEPRTPALLDSPRADYT
ncbi:unnamed protein product [Vitrella brassicaformis CCMP3155]|uniref:Uncharacterized protein n=1 Tax=Vitrella brassicaformis (strain CCMP3155) TaxID=1169540 RepID=A0A0G4GX44_VITBC|nr:unnamed protein product [Vitrella brassicaformis CCMP3155]|eukprot:CEM35593.1 unnamed protein product [Vitrella brassicaformis CCMP3155]